MEQRPEINDKYVEEKEKEIWYVIDFPVVRSDNRRKNLKATIKNGGIKWKRKKEKRQNYVLSVE